MVKDFSVTVKDRRSSYNINKDIDVSESKIKELVAYAIKHNPSSLDSKSTRTVILFRKRHDKFWEITKEALRKIVPEDKFKATEDKINSFKNGYGTILFFEDQSVIKTLKKKLDTYKDKISRWSLQSSGTFQYVVWTFLEIEGLGASLQHYNELIENKIKEEFKVPKNWKIISQMPFGNPTTPPGDKNFMPIEDRLKVLK